MMSFEGQQVCMTLAAEYLLSSLLLAGTMTASTESHSSLQLGLFTSTLVMHVVQDRSRDTPPHSTLPYVSLCMLIKGETVSIRLSGLLHTNSL